MNEESKNQSRTLKKGKTVKEKTKPTKIRSESKTKKDTKALNPTKQALKDAVEKQVSDLMDYSFRRIKHPDVDFITEDSLRFALNVNNIKGVDEKVLTEMIAMAKNAAKQGEEESSSEEDLVSKEEYKAMFKSLKLKIDVEGRVNN